MERRMSVSSSQQLLRPTAIGIPKLVTDMRHPTFPLKGRVSVVHLQEWGQMAPKPFRVCFRSRAASLMVIPFPEQPALLSNQARL